ncbi:MAG: 6,7-dimethyl-8-ribityllumazine synthase [Victivallaceae bacterium]
MDKFDLKNRVAEGNYLAEGLSIGIVASKFNYPVVKLLIEGASSGFVQHGGKIQDLSVVKVPGAFEISVTVKKLLQSDRRLDAIVCLGAVIKGETQHFEHVCNQVAAGIHSLSLEFVIPITFSILTTMTAEEAFARAGVKGANLGYEGIKTAIEMANLFKTL